MAEIMDFQLGRQEDGVLVISLTPSAAIGGRNFQFSVGKRQGWTASGLITKNMNSGFYGTSGMNIINSGQGIMSIALNSVDTSGRDFGAYAFKNEILDSGSRTITTQGYLLLSP